MPLTPRQREQVKKQFKVDPGDRVYLLINPPPGQPLPPTPVKSIVIIAVPGELPPPPDREFIPQPGPPPVGAPVVIGPNGTWDYDIREQLGLISFGYGEIQIAWKDERLPISPIWFPAPDIILSANESTLLKKLPKEEAYLDLAILYAQQGQWQRVLWVSLELMKVNPREANVYIAMAYSY